MRKLNKKIIIWLSIISLCLNVACGPEPSPTNSNGFGVTQYDQISQNPVKYVHLYTDAFLQLAYGNEPGSSGLHTQYTTSGRPTEFYVVDGVTEATWTITDTTIGTPCYNKPLNFFARNKRYTSTYCNFVRARTGITVAPENFVANTVENITVCTGGLSNQYGMPRSKLYDGNGYFIMEADAQNFSTNCMYGSQMSGNVNIPNLSSGNYDFYASNKELSGAYQDVIGTNAYIENEDPMDQCCRNDRTCCFAIASNPESLKSALAYDATCYAKGGLIHSQTGECFYPGQKISFNLRKNIQTKKLAQKTKVCRGTKNNRNT